MLNTDVPTAPSVVALTMVNLKFNGPHDGVVGLITFQFKLIINGTRSEISYTGIEVTGGTTMSSVRQGEETYTENLTDVVRLLPIVDWSIIL